MNTPAHAIVNLLVLGRRNAPSVALGAVAPDLPMLLFYGVEKLVLATPEHVIWMEAYFTPSWQAVFDSVHSFPVIAVAACLAWWRGSSKAVSFFCSMALHSAGDFLLHHDDAHRHFFPFSDWRFESPVSYWDPRHYGNLVAPIESLVVIAGSLWLMSRYREGRTRVLLGGAVVLYALYIGYALYVWA